MALIFNEEQNMLRDSARQFLVSQSPVSALRVLRDTNDSRGYSAELWGMFGDQGYCGILVPESLGGLGLGHVETGIVMEQIGHQLAALPFMPSCVVAVTAIKCAGSDEQQQHWLPLLASGKTIATMAIDEGNKHRPHDFALQASFEGSQLVLNGSKNFVLDGHVADLLIVVARSMGVPGLDDGVTLCLVESDTAGLEIERTIMVDAHNAARINFNNVKVLARDILGTPRQGTAALDLILNAGRLAAAAELSGIADEMLLRTVEYLKQRRQFDRLIGEFQALQHRLAYLYTELELTRALVIKAQQTLDTDPAAATWIVSAAKAKAGRTATLAVQEAVQMHGGMGMTDEFEIGFFMKRARSLQELFGDANFHLDQLAHQRGY